jgi:ankyrin repeat protein/nucleoside phosphorylase
MRSERPSIHRFTVYNQYTNAEAVLIASLKTKGDGAGDKHLYKMDGESSRKRKQAVICSQKRSDKYTVGWICAICTEYTAAQAAFDEEYERPECIPLRDHNDYAFGRIGEHDVVIAVLPKGDYGTTSAALVASDMLRSFAKIKVGLMVGIGGGAPSEKRDIRLGDVVVGVPRDGQSGVIQYDFGKRVQGEPFQTTRLLNQPPTTLLTAVNGLKSQYQRKCYGQLRETIEDILQNNPNLQREFGRPDLISDRLYRSEIIHSANGISTPDCSVSCGDDPSKLVVRAQRMVDESAPVVHYGLIASGNTLMKDAVLRDKLALEKNIICFEMEAAGLMNQFPCLVVRGICDYSDSHKNKQWQGYAAIAAAAYAKDLLHRIPLKDISELQRMARENQPPSSDQKKALLESLKFDQHKDRHDNIKAAHMNTCKWLQESVEYVDWLDPDKIHDHHGFLWIKGKPGAGKSTIMKSALATARERIRDRIIIFFFFNARGGILEKSTLGMYQSLLLQLLQQLPTLQDQLDFDFTKIHIDYRWHVEPLKSLFHQAIDNIQESKVVCFIDALDECDENEVRDMISFFEYLGGLAISKGILFLVCFSSRHYPYISVQHGLNLILENKKEHAQDIVKYVKSELRIGQSSTAIQIQADIPRRSRGIFMWIILVVLILNKEYDKGRIYNLQTKYQELPGDLYELFREILTRNSDGKSKETLRCLQWILFAERPLKPEELYCAILSDISPMWPHKEVSEHDIQRFVLSSSLGFADIIASNNYIHKTVQFIHESVKDFLLKGNGLREIWTVPSRDIHGRSHEELKQCCLRWIAMSSAICSDNSPSEERAILDQSGSEILSFSEYAVQYFLYHANAAQEYGISQAEFLKQLEANMWIMAKSKLQDGESSSDSRLLYILAKKNLSHLIRCHPSKLAFSEVGDECFGTPFFAALAKGNNEAILEFLKAQAENTPDFLGLYEEYCRKSLGSCQPQSTFRFFRHLNILSHFQLVRHDERSKILEVAFLLNMHPPYHNLDWDDECSQSPLLYVYSKGNKALLSILIEKCMSDVNEIPRFSSALLRAAIKKGHGDLVELLLRKGAKVDARDFRGKTALFSAVEGNQKDMAQLLIDAGADIEACGRRGVQVMTALSLAVIRGSCHKDMVDMLLEKGANTEAMDESGATPLIYATLMGNEDLATRLLERGSNIEAMDSNGQTPLMWAIKNRSPGLVRLLLNRGANVPAGKVTNVRPWPFEFSQKLRERLLATSELTLLEFAQQFEDEEIIKLLSRNGST